MSIPALEALSPLAQRGIRILVLLGAAYVLTLILKRLVKTFRSYTQEIAMRSGGGRDAELDKRAKTFAAIIKRTGSILIWLLAVAMVLREVGFDIAPILAGAGVVGVAVGFGAQSLVKDIISGMFILVENQIRVNDVAVINGTGGLVEEINLRTTVLRGVDGTVHVFPNGSINTLSNMTREYSYYVFEILVDYDQDTDRVIETVRAVAEELRGEEKYAEAILDTLDVLGVDRLGPEGVLVKMRIKTLPIQQWMVGREMNRRIKARFAASGIRVAQPLLRLQAFGGAADREELRRIIREVVLELRNEERGQKTEGSSV